MWNILTPINPLLMSRVTEYYILNWSLIIIARLYWVDYRIGGTALRPTSRNYLFCNSSKTNEKTTNSLSHFTQKL